MKTHIQKLVAANLRLDGRSNEVYRPITVERGVAILAEGSARVTIGDTVVIAGIKMSVGTPYPDQPDMGTISVNTEQLPLSNPDFESGPPGDSSIEWARIIDRGIRESKSLDFKKLCIERGKSSWTLNIDIYPINDAGNLFDAGALAAIAALQDAVFPEINNDGQVDYAKKTKKKVELQQLAVSVTVLKIGNNYVIDPLREEEESLDARLTVATRSDGALCALQKGGDCSLTTEDVRAMVALAMKKSKELRAHLEG